MSEKERSCAFVLWFFSEPKKISVHRHLGALVAHRHVIDPPTWCGVATTPLCGGRGDPHPLWRSSLVEPGIKVTVVKSAEET